MTQFYAFIFGLLLAFTVINSGICNSKDESADSVQRLSSSSDLGTGSRNRASGEETFASIVSSLTTRLEELGLESSIDKNYFADLEQKATEKELELILKCKHKGFNSHFKISANVAYRGKGTDAEVFRRAKDNVGQIHGFMYEDSTGYVFLGVISGSSQWLPDTRHSSRLAQELEIKSREAFSTHHSMRLSPQKYLEKAWRSIDNGVFIGGVTALYVTISPSKLIEISNLGRSWAGLYRNGVLVSWTGVPVHADGTVYHICKVQGAFRPEHYKDNAGDSLYYVWQAKVGDVFIVVSSSVRKALNPEQIYEASTNFQNPALGTDDFVGASVGILQRAGSISELDQIAEKIAIAVKLD